MKISIKKLVDNSNYKKMDIVDELQISKPIYYKLYNGNATNIQLCVLERICKLFKCTPNDVITGWNEYISPFDNQDDTDELPDHFISSLDETRNRINSKFYERQATPTRDYNTDPVKGIDIFRQSYNNSFPKPESVAQELIAMPEFKRILKAAIEEEKEQNKKDGTL